eukprot:1176761-Prorocentrum_minimum.AAC.6
MYTLALALHTASLALLDSFYHPVNIYNIAYTLALALLDSFSRPADGLGFSDPLIPWGGPAQPQIVPLGGRLGGRPLHGAPAGSPPRLHRPRILAPLGPQVPQQRLLHLLVSVLPVVIGPIGPVGGAAVAKSAKEGPPHGAAAAAGGLGGLGGLGRLGAFGRGGGLVWGPLRGGAVGH